MTVRGAARLAAALEEGRAEAALFKRLATLRRDVPLAEELSDLEWRGVPRVRFEEFCNVWGFGGLLDRPHRWAD